MEKHLHESENHLVKKFKEGKMPAFEMLFNKYHKPIYHQIHSLLNSKKETESIVVDIFIQLWEERQHCTDQNSFRTILSKTCNKAIKQHLRNNVAEEFFALVEEQSISKKNTHLQALAI